MRYVALGKLWSRVKASFEEIHEGSRLRRRRAPGRKNRPQVERRKAPLRQHCAHGSRSQLRGEHPLRRNGQTYMGEHRGSHAFGCGHAQSALHGDSRLRTVAPERPNAAFSLKINDGLMPAQFGWRLRRSGAIEVGWCPQHEPLASCDSAYRQRRVQQLSHAERYIDTLLHQIDLAVVEHDLQIKLRMLREELRQ